MSALEGTENMDPDLGGAGRPVEDQADAQREFALTLEHAESAARRLAADLAEMQRNIGRTGAPGPSGYATAAEGAAVAVRLLSQLAVDAAPDRIVAAAAIFDSFLPSRGDGARAA
ncbi:hypothetical protein [Amycolatopsis sp. cg9]|uniref:hypothetical protein n=1 Tax=Amycolatopsis sp. cg9 TaxID=3238801 RepID=UPI003524B7F1